MMHAEAASLKPASARQRKVAGAIMEVLANLFVRGRQLDAKLLANKVTFTKVEVSPDLRIANIFFVPFASIGLVNEQIESKITTPLSKKEYLEAFEKSKYSIRAQVTKDIGLKYSPELRFHYDTGYENASLTLNLLDQVKSSE